MPNRGWAQSPSSANDYGFNLGKWLRGQGIADVEWTVPAGLTSFGPTVNGNEIFIWLTGGTHGTVYTVKAKVTTDCTPPRIKEWAFDLLVSNNVNV